MIGKDHSELKWKIRVGSFYALTAFKSIGTQHAAYRCSFFVPIGQ